MLFSGLILINLLVGISRIWWLCPPVLESLMNEEKIKLYGVLLCLTRQEPPLFVGSLMFFARFEWCIGAPCLWYMLKRGRCVWTGCMYDREIFDDG